MKKALLSISLGLICHLLGSQDLIDDFQYNLDSLRNELQASPDGSERLEILRQIALTFTSINIDSVIYHGQKFLDAGEKLDDKNRQLDALGILGEAYIFKGALPKALELSLYGLQINEENPGLKSTDLEPGIGPVHYNLSEIYYQLDDIEKAHLYANTIIYVNESIVGSGYGHYMKARIFEKSNLLDSALFHINKALEIFEEAARSISHFSDKYDAEPDCFNLLARIYLKQGKTEKASSELKNILEINISKGTTISTANTYNDLAHLFLNQNQADSSIFYAGKALEESEKIDYVMGKLEAYTTLAICHESKDPVNALHYYKLANSTRNSLYGAGNIQVLKDMIAESEKKREEIAAAKIEYQNQLKMNAFIGITFTLLVVALFLYRNSRQKQKAKQKIEEAYDQLKATQSQLIQSEKMASLGELTAGIAHEIQNPLNFVNNFSEVNGELIKEIQEERHKTKDNRDEGLENVLLKDIGENQDKIIHHGQRASSIVKGMLEHSRTGDGTKEPTDINALADEYLRLAYHGLRAKDKSFNADFETDFDQSLPKISVIPQDIGRVLLNLINNAFHAVNERTKKETDYKPSVIVRTTQSPPYQGGIEGGVIIEVSDNGTGIPEHALGKIFQPFFTTKATGEGTGLGLSLSYDIVTKGHGGELSVSSEEQAGTTFIVKLPV
jgi:signal transduction histidine kinase